MRTVFEPYASTHFQTDTFTERESCNPSQDLPAVSLLVPRVVLMGRLWHHTRQEVGGFSQHVLQTPWPVVFSLLPSLI